MGFKFGSKDLTNPKAIIGKVKLFGMIKYFKSIKNIIKNDKLNIIKNTVVNDAPYK